MNELVAVDAGFAKANLHSELSEHHQEAAVIEAAKCGHELNKLKAVCPHGEWVQWLGEKFGGSKETAKRYMRLDRELPELKGLKRSPGTHLPGIKPALAMLNAPDEIKEEFKEKIEQGETFTEAQVKAAVKAAKDAAQKEADERAKNWRKQAIKERDEKRSAEDLVAAKVKEAKVLRETIDKQIEIGVKDALKAETAEIQRAMREAKESEAAAKERIKAMREQRAKDIEKGIKEGLKAQQDEITSKQLQLDAITGKIDVLKRQLDRVAEQDQVVSHFETHRKALERLITELAVAIGEALDPDFAPYMPTQYIPLFEKIADRLRQGADGIERSVGAMEKRQPLRVIGGNENG